MERFLDRYCERAGEASLLAEPLNAVTNIAFLIAAIVIWRHLARWPGLSLRRAPDIAVLAATVFAIGLGSASWHIYPVRPTHLADVGPIMIFILGYIAAFMVRIAGLSWPLAIGVVVLFLLASAGAPALLAARPLGGSGAYLPALAALAVTATVMVVRRHRRARLMAAAAALFSISLALRSVDLDFCASWPHGTHFLWHMLNAAVLYTLMRLLAEEVRHGAAAPA